MHAKLEKKLLFCCVALYVQNAFSVTILKVGVAKNFRACARTRSPAPPYLKSWLRPCQIVVLSGDREMARESHMIEARDIKFYVEEAQQQ